jgi:hypothetical protein
VENGNLVDAAVFFNSVNFNPITTHFGMFDATELWHFTGKLITTSISNTVKAMNVVNRFDIAYLFNSQDKNEHNIFELVRIAKTIPVIVTNALDEKEAYRITGVAPKLISNFSVQKIREVFDE